MNVPFLDLQGSHEPLREEILEVIGQVIETGIFSGGPFVEKFEQEFATYCETDYALGVKSGTDALWLTMLALNIGPGDEVITVPMSFIATAAAISLTGAKPVFVDIDPRTYTMDPSALEAALTPRTKAVIPVHLYGQSADMDPILAFAAKHGLYVIEDAAQAHGATYQGKKAGSLGHAGCFSFYPAKNLGAIGEGGAITTDDESLVLKIRALREHGQTQKNSHTMLGWNSRMDGIQAAVLSLKLSYLDGENHKRRQHANYYDQALKHLPAIITPVNDRGAGHVYHIYAIQAPNRERMVGFFNYRGIGYGLHYPTPIHLQNAYHHLACEKGSFPVSETCANRMISLPIYPGITVEQLNQVVEAIVDLSDSRLIA
jgi:dTDP-4-amino-4,6-dideoxygalactose transaminase